MGAFNPSRQIHQLLNSCTKPSHLHQLHAHLISTSLIHHPPLLSTFFSHHPNYARKLLDQMPNPTHLHYNALLKGYSQSPNPSKALPCYIEMRRHGFRADAICTMFVVRACGRMGCLLGGMQLHGRIVRDGLRSDSMLLTALMDLYGTCGDGVSAQRVFVEMSEKDIVAWNVLVSCYVKNGRTRDALGLFDVMREGNCGSRPDDVTCLFVLQACWKLNALEFGEKVNRYIEENGYGDLLNLRNSLVTMYSKCGSVDKALCVFRGTSRRNVASWSTMISGFAMNGCGRDALEAFYEMVRVGVVPDEQTFTGVLSACSHCGMVDEGFDFFNSMSKKYGISPNIHHYGCMVDLFSRAGLLDQAYDFITKSMKVKPDPTIWRTLLGACRVYGHFDLGERVMGHLIELKAQEAGDYVLLLNIHSSAGNWDKVVELRKTMKDKAIQTLPGCSTIELHGMVHEFLRDDASHPRMTEIYEMLEEIRKQLKLGGYVADMKSEMHNLDSEGKEFSLSYHSEKLAIALGVLATPPGTAIRIANNLRICVDCHTFSKVLSSVYNRTVIIRDRARFHHFREGRCSCNDYW